MATLTLNRPDKRNAISYELIDELLRALHEVQKSPAQILILTGAGTAFCSGMDLDNLRSITRQTEEENLADSGRMAHLFRTLYEFPKVTIAAVNGAAIAGGCGLATLCDFTLASVHREVRLHRGPHRICSRHRLHFSAAPGRREAGARSIADRPHHRLPTKRIASGLVNEVVRPEQLARSRA